MRVQPFEPELSPRQSVALEQQPVHTGGGKSPRLAERSGAPAEEIGEEREERSPDV